MLSHRDVEDLLTERGPAVPHGTVRRWVLNFAPAIARRLRHRRASPKGRWRHEEMVVRIAAADRYVRRAVDSEDGGLGVMVERRRDNAATRKLMRKLLRKQGFAPAVAAPDKLRSNGACFAGPGLTAQHERGLRQDNRAGVSHRPVRRRERKMQRSSRSAPSIASSLCTPPSYNTDIQRHLIVRRTPSDLPCGSHGTLTRGDSNGAASVRTSRAFACRLGFREKAAGDAPCSL